MTDATSRPMWNRLSVQKTLGYPDAPKSIYGQKEPPWPDRRPYREHYYPEWVPLLTADDIEFSVADSEVPDRKNSISDWISHVFFAPGCSYATEEVADYFIAACHELGFPAIPGSRWLNNVTSEDNGPNTLTKEQQAAAWNRAMEKLGYVHEADCTARKWDNEYDKTPANQWKRVDRGKWFPWKRKPVKR